MGNERNDQKDDLKEELEKLKAQNEALRKERDEAKARAEEAEKEARAKSDELEAQVARQEALIIKQISQQRKAKIVIPSGRSAHERCPVPVGLNGREFLITRDKEVDVPVGVLEVLNLAQASIARSGGKDERASVVFEKAPRFPYRLVGYIDPATGKLENA